MSFHSVQTLCKAVAIACQYFFLAGYSFMCLEGIQTMVIVGRIMGSGHVFSTFANVAIGWGKSCNILFKNFVYI